MLNSAVPGNGGGVNAAANDCRSSAEASSSQALTFALLIVVSYPCHVEDH